MGYEIKSLGGDPSIWQIDLSEASEPITDRFRSAAPVRLKEEDLAFFERNGYLSGIRILSGEQIDFLRSELDELMAAHQSENPCFYEYHRNESRSGRVLFHALGAWRVSEGFHDLIFHPAITSTAGQLLAGAVRFWHDQLFVKPAHDGAVVAWHQDYSYWTRTVPLAHLTCWIALDDATVENGCLHYVPGSHKWPLLPRTDLADDMDAVLGVLTAQQRERFEPVPVELKKGEATFHHPMMLHGSYANRSARPRRGAVVNMIKDGVRSDSDEPLLAGVPPIPKGEPLNGRFFPILAHQLS